MTQEGKITQSQKDEDEFLSDLDVLRSKWTMKNKSQYTHAIKALISEFTHPDHIDLDEPEVEYLPARKVRNGDPNIV